MAVQELQKKRLFGDRVRTNVLRKQKAISTLVRHVPERITPDMLTAIGFLGSLLVLTGLVLARYQNPNFLLLPVAGLALNWLGDSLDGRIAYYRKIPRKWYGFSLDIIMDWQSIVVMGLGSLIYLESNIGHAFTFLVVAMYGWSMIISQLRFKISGTYHIDSGLLGPTEFRIILAFIIILEFFYPGYLVYFLGVISVSLLGINVSDTRKLLETADAADQEEKTLSRKLKHSPPTN
jgi:hypothetical protein